MNAISDERMSLPSASNMERYFQCAGCRALEKAVEKQRVPMPELTNAAAEQGSLLHEANESGDVTELAMSDAAQVQKIRESEEAITRIWCDDHNIDFKTITVVREQRMFLPFPNGRACSAKLDTLVLADGGNSLVIDAKSGRKAVTTPARNWQGRVCVAVASSHYRFSKARFAIANLFGKIEPPVDYNESDILQIKKLLMERLDLIEQPDQPRTPSDACEFCSGKHVCPEQRARLGTLIHQRTINWDIIAPEQKAPLWKMADMGEKVSKAIKAQIKSDLASGEEIPGLTKRPDGETRKITSAEAAYRALDCDISGGVDDYTFMRSCSISLESFKELYCNLTGHGTDEAEKFITDKLGSAITKSPRSGSVVVKKE